MADVQFSAQCLHLLVVVCICLHVLVSVVVGWLCFFPVFIPGGQFPFASQILHVGLNWIGDFVYQAHCSLVLARRQVELHHFVIPFDYAKFCSMMEAIGEVVAGDLQTLMFIVDWCGLFLDEGSLGHYFDVRAWRKDSLLSEEGWETLANSSATRVVADDEPYYVRPLAPACHLTTQEGRARAVAPAISGQRSNFGIGLEPWKGDVSSPRPTGSADD